MEFVTGLPASIDTLEIPVDGWGRAECFQGRVRITYYRLAVGEDGTGLVLPAVCLVWSLPALQAARPHFIRFWQTTEQAEQPFDRLTAKSQIFGLQ